MRVVQCKLNCGLPSSEPHFSLTLLHSNDLQWTGNRFKFLKFQVTCGYFSFRFPQLKPLDGPLASSYDVCLHHPWPCLSFVYFLHSMNAQFTILKFIAFHSDFHSSVPGWPSGPGPWLHFCYKLNVICIEYWLSNCRDEFIIKKASSKWPAWGLLNCNPGRVLSDSLRPV